MRRPIEGNGSSPLEELERDLHELCQPLTALHCQLESAQKRAEESGLEEVIAEALGQTRRAFQTAGQMQVRLQAVMEAMERSREEAGHG
jgi:hypothetical protein